MKFRIILGVFLILIGIAVIGDKISDNNLWSLIGTYWPLILIFFGLDNLFSKHHSKFFAGFMIALGILFQLGNLDLIHLKWYDLIFPSILIAIGIRVLVPAKYFKNKKKFDKDTVGEILENTNIHIKNKINFNGTIDENFIENYNVFSGFDTRVNSQAFRGGEIGSIFGGAKIDLRDALLNNNKARLELYAIFGGIEVIVPKNWIVIVKGTPIFGGVDNKTVYEGENETENTPRLTIEAFAIFGGVDIYNT